MISQSKKSTVKEMESILFLPIVFSFLFSLDFKLFLI